MGNAFPVTGIILAGGEGRRMDGQDKGWIPFRGKPLVEHVLARLQPQVTNCIISANRNLERYQTLGASVVRDAEVYLGPLAGIAHALASIETDYGLVIPTDAPLLPMDLAERLWQRLPAKLVICHDGERLQPLFGLYHRSLVPSITAYLESGQRQLTRWCMAQDPEIVTIGDTFSFTNLNTPEELKRATQHLDNPQT